MTDLEHTGSEWEDATVAPPRRNGEEYGATDGYGAAPERVSFDRMPPQDLEAEQSVLGGMLLSKDAIADVVEALQGHDFYKPAHQTIYAAILDLYAKGEPADPITVSNELTKRGELAKVGGAGYVHSLVQTVPTAANAEYYAEIVHDRAILRRLVQAGTRITQMGYAADGDVDEIVNSAQAEVYQVTEQRTAEDYLVLGEIMEGALDEIEAISNRSGEMTGVPTGFTDLDSLTNGLHPGQMVVIAARPAMGKCLAAGSRVVEARTGASLTIAEFVRRGIAGEPLEVHTLTADGRLRPVRPDAFLPNGRRPVHRLTTHAGHSIVATAQHPFRTPRGWVPLQELRPGDRIAVAGSPTPARGGGRQHPAPGGTPRPVGASAAAGAVNAGAHAVGAAGADELAPGRGFHPTTDDAVQPPVITPALAPGQPPTTGAGIAWAPIASIQSAGEDEVYDLTVDGTHNFVAEGMVVHNSTLALDFARACSIKHHLPSVIFSLEMGRNEIAMRLLSAEARVALHHMRSGSMTDEDWNRVARQMSEVNEAPLYIDDSPNLSMMEIRAKCRRLKQRNDLRLIIIDYLQLMQTGGSRRPESRQQEVSEMSRNLKLLAKELEVPVIALSQLNRGPEQRTDKKPMVSDLRESGSIEQDSDLVVLLHREDAYEKESPRAGEADLIVAKHRNGPTATITVAFQGHYSRFVNMEGGF